MQPAAVATFRWRLWRSKPARSEWPRTRGDRRPPAFPPERRPELRHFRVSKEHVSSGSILGWETGRSVPRGHSSEWLPRSGRPACEKVRAGGGLGAETARTKRRNVGRPDAGVRRPWVLSNSRDVPGRRAVSSRARREAVMRAIDELVDRFERNRPPRASGERRRALGPLLRRAPRRQSSEPLLDRRLHGCRRTVDRALRSRGR